MTATAAVLAVYACWVAATYALEGSPRTLLRPDAPGLRLGYTLVANIVIGTAGAMLVLERLVTEGGVGPAAVGFGSPRRALAGVVVGIATGGAAYLAQGAPSLDPVVLLNGVAQVLPVSVAEVLVCWSLVSALVGAGGPARRILAAGASSLLFGVYHVAHSPPFNALAMIAFLTLVGLATSAFFVLTRDLCGTVVFHSALALTGVLGALAEAGALDAYRAPRPALLGTAAVSVAVTVLLRRRLRRRAA
jgi:hypothetical protein